VNCGEEKSRIVVADNNSSRIIHSWWPCDDASTDH